MTHFLLTVQVTVPDGRLLRSRYRVDGATLLDAAAVSSWASERYMRELITRYVPAGGTEVEGTGSWQLSRTGRG